MREQNTKAQEKKKMIPTNYPAYTINFQAIRRQSGIYDIHFFQPYIS